MSTSDNILDDQQKAANLARVRDNQRRSRARRKEYLRELEERYRQCEQTGIEASAEMQTAARRVIDENRVLRSLLIEHGYTEKDLDRICHDCTGSAPAVPALRSLFGQTRPVSMLPEPGEISGIGGSSSNSNNNNNINNSNSNSNSNNNNVVLVPGSNTAAQIRSPELASVYSQHASPTNQHLRSPIVHQFPQTSPPFTATSMTPNPMVGAMPIQHQQQQQQQRLLVGSNIHRSSYPQVMNIIPHNPQIAVPSGALYGMPSLHMIKTELGYNPEEEIDEQSTDAEYSLTEEQAFDANLPYPR